MESKESGRAEPPAEGERLLAKDAAAALNGPPVNPEALKGGFTLLLALSVAAAACGSSFIFGYNIGAINPPSDCIKAWINDSLTVITTEFNETINSTITKYDFMTAKQAQIWMWAVALFPFGGIFGGMACGLAADRLGRKTAMLANNVLCVAAAALMASSKAAESWHMLLLGRFIIGINCGLNSGLAPMYLTEISPVNLRGMLGSVNQLMVTVSILVASVVGLENVLGGPEHWPWVFAFMVIPTIWQCVAFPFCPESPKYLLIVKHQREAAERALQRLRNKVDVSAELKAMQDESDKLASVPKVSFGDMFKKPLLRWALLIAAFMMLAQQFSGINAAFYYSNQIFTQTAKLTSQNASYATLGMCAVNVVMTIVSTAIVDRFGRRILLLVGMGGMWACSILIVIFLTFIDHGGNPVAYTVVVFVYLFIVSFATGPGSIPWFYVSELFDQGARPNANAVAVMTNWGSNFLVGLLFGPWAELVGPYAFLVFTGFLTFFWLFTFFYAPETKNRQLEDIEEELKRKAPPGFR